MKTIQSSRLGVVEVNENEIFTFTQAILGFEEHREFALIQAKQAFAWLQSTENPEIAFALINASQIKVPVYQELFDDLAEVYVLLAYQQDSKALTANLQAPLLLRPKTQEGLQKVLESPDLSLQEDLKALL